MKSRTRAVVIGGGIAGCSTLYHLTREGWSDVMLLERDELTSGTTWHSATPVHRTGCGFSAAARSTRCGSKRATSTGRPTS